MKKKIMLMAGLFVLTVSLTACRDDDNGYDDDHTTVPTEATATEVTDSTYGYGENNRPESPEITLERAIELAYEDLEDRGITATFYADSGMEWERDRWVWELTFRTEGEQMPYVEYYISVEDGSVVKFEWDD